VNATHAREVKIFLPSSFSAVACEAGAFGPGALQHAAPGAGAPVGAIALTCGVPALQPPRSATWPAGPAKCRPLQPYLFGAPSALAPSFRVARLRLHSSRLFRPLPAPIGASPFWIGYRHCATSMLAGPLRRITSCCVIATTAERIRPCEVARKCIPAIVPAHSLRFSR
jgi:hypothetical protein